MSRVPKKQSVYHSRQPYKSTSKRRVRKSAHNSILPYRIARLTFVKKIRHMSHTRKFVLVGWSIASFLVIVGLFTTIYFANSLGSKERIMNRNKTGLTLVDQNDEVFFSFYNAHSNSYVALDSIAPIAKKAILSSEDKDFYKHRGFSIPGITNAIYQNLRPGGLDNGGSTITQQLVKNALLSEQRSLLRKYQELVLSIEIERRYSKDEILEMYLNSVYFGEGAFGIEDAAQTYFGVAAKDLNLPQASMLIGVLQAPSAYSPISGSMEKALQRQKYVLNRMYDDNAITESEKAEALNTQLVFSGTRKTESEKAPHFALMVKSELEEKYGESVIARSGFRVKTTLNMDWQEKAELAVAKQVGRLAVSNVTNGSSVIIDPKNGEIRALVGSVDWNNETFGKFNIATSTKRQPGSSFKPIVYATGIENRDYSAASLFEDKPTDFGGYTPKNYDLRYRGDVTLRRALANSLNIPAVEALQKAGIDNVLSTSKKFGISTLNDDTDYGLSLALGSGPVPLTEMTNTYATFANAGSHTTTTTISSITDKNNRQIYQHKPKFTQAISPQTAYIMSSILSDNTARSELFGSSLNLNNERVAAVKTGTTEDYRDAWTIGYTPSIAVGVWIGNNDNSQMSRVAGSSGAAPIWKSLMQDILLNTPLEQFTVPLGITTRTICRSNGALAQTSGTNTLTEYFKPGTLPTTTCNQPQSRSSNNSAPSQLKQTGEDTVRQNQSVSTGSDDNESNTNQTLDEEQNHQILTDQLNNP